MAKVNLDISKRLDITCRRGDSFSLTLTLKDSSGSAIDLSTRDFIMQVRRSNNGNLLISTNSDNAETTPTQFKITSNSGSVVGALLIELAAADMATVPAGRYVYDLAFVDTAEANNVDSESNEQTVLKGSFNVVEDVTTTAT